MISGCPKDGCWTELHYEEITDGKWRVRHGDNPEHSRVFWDFECVWGRDVAKTAQCFPLFGAWLDELHAYISPATAKA